MDRKFAETGMEARLPLCKSFPIKTNPNRIVVHKRERACRYEEQPGETIAIIYYHEGPDGTEHKNIRLLVLDGVTYTLEAVSLP